MKHIHAASVRKMLSPEGQQQEMSAARQRMINWTFTTEDLSI
ncbi:hypothetical protein N9K24_03485 [Amylibacter sp.]|nr:hypothetical protein [Amylibacter sp.]